MSGSTIFINVLFFVALIWGVWWLAWQTSKAHHELLREQQEDADKEQEEERETKKYNPKRPKREVVFRDAEEEEAVEEEAPKGEFVYDPKAHKVTWVPAE